MGERVGERRPEVKKETTWRKSVMYGRWEGFSLWRNEANSVRKSVQLANGPEAVPRLMRESVDKRAELEGRRSRGVESGVHVAGKAEEG